VFSCFVYAVDGVLSALEDRCLITNSPVSVISAAILGDKLRSLTFDKNNSMLLTDDARVLIVSASLLKLYDVLHSCPMFELFIRQLV